MPSHDPTPIRTDSSDVVVPEVNRRLRAAGMPPALAATAGVGIVCGIQACRPASDAEFGQRALQATAMVIEDWKVLRQRLADHRSRSAP